MKENYTPEERRIVMEIKEILQNQESQAAMKQDDITLIEIKDYIKKPKPNGYRSLHLIISVPIFLKDEKRDMKVEVQLPWIFGRVLNTRSDIRKIFPRTCRRSWQRNYCIVQIKVQNWI